MFCSSTLVSGGRSDGSANSVCTIARRAMRLPSRSPLPRLRWAGSAKGPRAIRFGAWSPATSGQEVGGLDLGVRRSLAERDDRELVLFDRRQGDLDLGVGDRRDDAPAGLQRTRRRLEPNQVAFAGQDIDPPETGRVGGDPDSGGAGAGPDVDDPEIGLLGVRKDLRELLQPERLKEPRLLGPELVGGSERVSNRLIALDP